MGSDNDSNDSRTRLARVRPGKVDDDIYVETFDISYSSAPQYCCISYISSDTKSNIIRDGQIHHIDSVLANALKALRSDADETVWWAENLTTGNETEKSISPKDFQNTFQHAESVRLWLDHGDKYGPQAFQLFKEFAKHWRTFATEMGLPDNWSHARPDQMMQVIQKVQQLMATDPASFTGMQDAAIVEATSALADAPFFRHVKAITSIVLANDAIITINGSEIQWEDYCHGLNLIVSSGRTLPVKCSAVQFMLVQGIKIAGRRWRENNHHLELLPMLQQTRQSECVDLRDRVFSMLPITSPCKRVEMGAGIAQPPLEIDYAATPQQVFINAARYIIGERQDLLIWNAIPAPSKSSRLAGLPSWCPDWSDAADVSALRIRPSMALRSWEAARCVQQVRKPLLTTESGILRAQAHILSKVKTVADEKFTDENFQDPILDLMQLLPPSELMHGSDHFPRTLMLDQWQFNDKAPKSMLKSWVSFTAKIQTLKMLGITPQQFVADPSIVTRSAPTTPDAAQQAVFRLCTKYDTTQISQAITQALGRRFFVLESGHLGLTYVEEGDEDDEESKIRPGDVIAVFVGGYLPYVLRECSQSGQGVKKYKLLGEVHVQGLMEGEALKNKGWVCDTWKDVKVDDVEIV